MRRLQQPSEVKKVFQNKEEEHVCSILSVFIIHIHIDRFLIQHVFDSVTVFFSAWLFFCLFFTRITIKNDKDNTMYDSTFRFLWQCFFLNGFCISRLNRCGVAGQWNHSKVLGKAYSPVVPQYCWPTAAFVWHPLHSSQFQKKKRKKKKSKCSIIPLKGWTPVNQRPVWNVRTCAPGAQSHTDENSMSHPSFLFLLCTVKDGGHVIVCSVFSCSYKVLPSSSFAFTNICTWKIRLRPSDFSWILSVP